MVRRPGRLECRLGVRFRVAGIEAVGGDDLVGEDGDLEKQRVGVFGPGEPVEDGTQTDGIGREDGRVLWGVEAPLDFPGGYVRAARRQRREFVGRERCVDFLGLLESDETALGEMRGAHTVSRLFFFVVEAGEQEVDEVAELLRGSPQQKEQSPEAVRQFVAHSEVVDPVGSEGGLPRRVVGAWMAILVGQRDAHEGGEERPEVGGVEGFGPAVEDFVGAVVEEGEPVGGAVLFQAVAHPQLQVEQKADLGGPGMGENLDRALPADGAQGEEEFLGREAGDDRSEPVAVEEELFTVLPLRRQDASGFLPEGQGRGGRGRGLFGAHRVGTPAEDWVMLSGASL